jgi:hypothetical protein
MRLASRRRGTPSAAGRGSPPRVGAYASGGPADDAPTRFLRDNACGDQRSGALRKRCRRRRHARRGPRTSGRARLDMGRPGGVEPSQQRRPAARGARWNASRSSAAPAAMPRRTTQIGRSCGRSTCTSRAFACGARRKRPRLPRHARRGGGADGVVRYLGQGATVTFQWPTRPRHHRSRADGR